MGFCLLCDRESCPTNVEVSEPYFEVTFAKRVRSTLTSSDSLKEPNRVFSICSNCGDKLLFSITNGAELPFERLKDEAMA